MDRKTVIRENLVDRYVRGELTPEEERRFEEFYLTDQWTQQELTATLSLRRALKDDVPANDETPDAAPVTELARSRSERAIARRVPLRPWAAAAGLAAAAALSGGVGYWLGDQGEVAAGPAVLHNLQRIELIETRSRPTHERFELVEGQPVLLVVEVGYTGEQPLGATLRSLPDKTPVLSIDDAMLDEYGRMSTALPKLDPGPYRLELEEKQSGNLVAWFTFEVR